MCIIFCHFLTYTVSQKKDTTQPPTIISTIVVWFQQFLVQMLLSKYAIKRCLDISPHLFIVCFGNSKILKIMNLASNCRYPLWFPLLCRKWVWLSWSLSTLEWKSTASITTMFYSLSADAASDQACCQRYVLSTRQRSISSCKDTIKRLQQETLDFIGP